MQLIVLLLVSLMAFPVFAKTDPVQDAISQMRSNYEQINSREDVQQRLIVPATSDQVNMQTLNGNQTFDATLVCPGTGPVVVVTAIPEGSISSPGELQFIAEYDSDLNGDLDVSITSRHVAGMCSDGFIAECNPPGSWEECKFYKWFYRDGIIQALAVDPDNNRDISIADLHGCFCFNQSCGSPIMGNLDTILSYYANGIINLLRENGQNIVITRVNNDLENMQIAYIGANPVHCTTNSDELYDSRDIQELTSLQNHVEFNEDVVIDSQMSNSSSPWSLTQRAFEQANQEYEYRQCTIRARVASRTEVRTRNPVLACDKVATDPQDPVWVDWTGTEGPGYWYADYGKTKHVLQQNELMRIAISPSYCDPAPFIQTTVEVLCGDNWITVWSRDLGYDWGGCSGGTFDSINIGSQDFVNYVLEEADIDWPRWKYECGTGEDQCLASSDLCRCVITDDIFTCYSPSMGPGDGSLIINGANSTIGEEYDRRLYQGCEEITEPENGCLALQNDPNCELVEEITDGVPTIQGGVTTGLEPFPDCRLIEGSVRSITVCEPWWEKERIYRCSNNATDFSQVQQRVEHISSNIQYDNSTGEWTGQGDLQFDENGTSYSVIFDPNIQFKAQMENCEPACLVAMPNKNTNIMVHGLDNTVNFNQSKVYVKTRPCIKNDETGQYECPYNATEGETISTPCTCFDQKTFSEVASEMATLKSSSMDMICSSGDKAGVCGPEDEGIQTNRVICVTDPTVSWSSDGELTVENGTVQDCSPNTWQNTNGIPDQTHTIKTTNDYRCWAGIDGFSEEMGSTTDSDYFQNNLGPLAPVSSWFDPAVEWAKSLIIDHLKSDPYFIPEPGPDCPCQGSDSNSTSTPDGSGGTYECTWTVETSVDNINRSDDLKLRPNNQDPFGDVYLFFSRTGKWGGSHIGACSQQYLCSPSRGCYDDKSICNNNCKIQEYCVNQPIEYTCNANGLTYSILDDCINNCVETISGTCTVTPEDTVYVYDNGICDGQNCKWNTDCWSSYIGCSATIDTASCPSGYTEIDKSVYKTITCARGGNNDCKSSYNLYKHTCYKPAQSECSLTGQTWTIVDGNDPCPSNCQMDDQVDLYDTEDLCKANCPYQCRQVWKNTDVQYVYDEGGCDGQNCNWNADCWSSNLDCPASINIATCPSGYTEIGKSVYKTIKCLRGGDNNCDKLYDLYKHTCIYTEYAWVCSQDTQCQVSADNYYCPASGVEYTDSLLCQENCIGDNPCEIRYTCSLEQYQCKYSTNNSCTDACIEDFSCNAQTDDYRFKVTIRNNGSNDYTQELDLIEPEERHIASDSYNHEDLILQQCVDRYFRPFINMDDETFGGHYEYAPADLLIYQYAGVNGQLPYDSDTHTLPDDDREAPVVYRPSPTVPLTPQFPDKTYTSVWSDDDALRLGAYTIQISSLRPLVYYYECPEGQIVAGSDPALCDANMRPLGGVDDTINGEYCFQNRCTRADIEPQDRVYSGCGYVNDGTWQ